MAACPDCGFPLLRLDVDGPAAGTPFAWHYDESTWAAAGATITAGCKAAAELVRTRDRDHRARGEPPRCRHEALAAVAGPIERGAKMAP